MTDELPVQYNMMFLSIIKECLKTANKNLLETIFGTPDNPTYNQKNINFSVKIINFKYDKENELFLNPSKVLLNISTTDMRILLELYDGFTRKKEYLYKKYKLNVSNTRVLEDKLITKPIAIFKTGSPLFLKNKLGENISVDTKDFEDSINYIADITLKNFRGTGLKQRLSFCNIDLKKKVCKLDVSKYDKNIFVNAYVGKFALTGDIEDLNYIHNTGLGFRRSEGFGFLNLLEG